MLENIFDYIDYKRDMQNALDTAKLDAVIEAKVKTAKQMKLYNETIDKIMLYTGLSKEEIDQIKP